MRVVSGTDPSVFSDAGAWRSISKSIDRLGVLFMVSVPNLSDSIMCRIDKNRIKRMYLVWYHMIYMCAVDMKTVHTEFF